MYSLICLSAANVIYYKRSGYQKYRYLENIKTLAYKIGSGYHEIKISGNNKESRINNKINCGYYEKQMYGKLHDQKSMKKTLYDKEKA